MREQSSPRCVASKTLVSGWLIFPPQKFNCIFFYLLILQVDPPLIPANVVYLTEEGRREHDQSHPRPGLVRATADQSFLSHPDLQLYPLVASVDGLDLEVDAHRADKRWREGVVCITEEEGGLPHAAVPDDEDFKHVVKVLV